MEKKIIGYRVPYDLFNGHIQKGLIYRPLASVNNTTYAATANGAIIDSGRSNLPKEIVEKWEPVYEFIWEIGDFIKILPCEVDYDDPKLKNSIQIITGIEPKGLRGNLHNRLLFDHPARGIYEPLVTTPTVEELRNYDFFIVVKNLGVLKVNKSGIYYKDEVIHFNYIASIINSLGEVSFTNSLRLKTKIKFILNNTEFSFTDEDFIKAFKLYLKLSAI